VSDVVFSQGTDVVFSQGTWHDLFVLLGVCLITELTRDALVKNLTCMLENRPDNAKGK